MHGNVGYEIDRADIAHAIIRLMLASMLLMHALSQLVALWPVAPVLDGPSDAVILAGAAAATGILLGAILLIIGFKTRPAAIALILLVAGVTLFDLMVTGAAGSALDFLPRLTVMIGLLLPAAIGGEGLSVDGRTPPTLRPTEEEV
jgi:uncharacterized membrane protein YphA (DoxX/SURF4 family)